MLTKDEDILHALRRNGVGARAIVAIHRIGPCSIGRLARVLGTTRHRVRVAIRGRDGEIRAEHTLIELGCLRGHRDHGQLRFGLSERGARWAGRVEEGLVEGEAVGRAVRRREELR